MKQRKGFLDGGMKHKHHIIPKHMGGSDEPDNLIELTVEEHAEAHRKLFEEHGRWQDRVAWLSLSGIMKDEERIEAILKNWTGRTHTEESKTKIGEWQKGRKHKDETKLKISKSLSGRPSNTKGSKRTDEFKKNVSNQKKGNTYGKCFKGKSWYKDPTTGKRVWVDNSVNI